MRFEKSLAVDVEGALKSLGYGRAGDVPLDGATEALAQKAAGLVAAAAQPRWVYRRFLLGVGCHLDGTETRLAGEDIALHLAGCEGCYLLAVTLGAGVEQALNAAQAADMALAVVMDAAASRLAEQYAALAEAAVRAEAAQDGFYATGRFSPGYGDMPLAQQGAVLDLLNAQKAIGLVVGGGGLMLPRKSVTAVMGYAKTPVSGHLAGCGGCRIYEKCEKRKEGDYCGKPLV